MITKIFMKKHYPHVKDFDRLKLIESTRKEMAKEIFDKIDKLMILRSTQLKIDKKQFLHDAGYLDIKNGYGVK